MTSLSFISFTATLNALPIAHIDSGALHVCALFSSGSVVCWGTQANAVLGSEISDANSNLGDQPGEMIALVPIMFKNTIRAVQVAAGSSSTCGKRP